MLSPEHCTQSNLEAINQSIDFINYQISNDLSTGNTEGVVVWMEKLHNAHNIRMMLAEGMPASLRQKA